ncbi:MAG: amidohydrolase family protein [Proteobacteria bacterium]|nr:amidohydrolase family protein [Pseudomonadota bacterium]HQR02827.1 amidohydrolase family protein [Rhodocyclaceae bacterium]
MATPEYDVVIRNGMIVDGARNPRHIGDICIKDGRIARIGVAKNIRAKREIDATGLVVAPGFIDLHTHYDAQVYWDPYLSTSGFHGVTSVVIGNCGFGFAPMKEEYRQRAMQSMTKVEAIPLVTMQKAIPWNWTSYPEYLDSLDALPKALNILPYVPVNPLLIEAMGFTDAKAGRKPTEAEHAKIAALLNEAMDAGACGWSAQCLGQSGKPEEPTMGGAAQTDFDGSPMPTDVMWPETRALLAKILGDRGEGFIALSMGLQNPDEWEKLAAMSKAPIMFQAIVPAGDESGKMIRRHLLNWLDSCHQRGLQIYGQGITQDPPLIFTFDYWDLWGSTWNKYFGPDVELATRHSNAASAAVREELKKAPLKYQFIDAIPDTRVHKAKNPALKSLEGKTLGEIAQSSGKHVVDTVCDLIQQDGFDTIFETRQFDTTLEGVKELLDNHNIIPGLSDGGAHLKYLTCGSYGTEMIAEYVRREKLISLEEAHWRLSALPAFCAGFQDRGILREGAAADIIIYDYEKLDYTFPEFVRDLPGDEYRATNKGTGYRYVLVNGQVTVEDDKPTHTHSGALLRNGKIRPALAKAA